MVEKMNSQSEEKEKENNKLANVEVEQLLSQSTLLHLPTNNDDADDVVDDGMVIVLVMFEMALATSFFSPNRSSTV